LRKINTIKGEEVLRKPLFYILYNIKGPQLVEAGQKSFPRWFLRYLFFKWDSIRFITRREHSKQNKNDSQKMVFV
jgi:hypothetical protein